MNYNLTINIHHRWRCLKIIIFQHVPLQKYIKLKIKYIMKSYRSSLAFVLALILCQSLCKASPIADDPDLDETAFMMEDEDGEARFLTSANGGFSLTNATFDVASLLAGRRWHQ